MSICANCREQIYGCRGESSIYGSHGVGDLCENCWLDEDELIDSEGTNAPEYSEAIKNRLAHYRGVK